MTSTLDPDLIPEPDRSLGRGHGTDALGPSDTTDTGSDVQPGVHAIEELDIGLDRGTNEDSTTRSLEVSGDSDATGTGERASAGRDVDFELGVDIDVDRIDRIDTIEDLDEIDLASAEPTDVDDPDLLAPQRRLSEQVRQQPR